MGLNYLLNPAMPSLSQPWLVLMVVGTAIAYLSLNHVFVGLALVLARALSWRESGVWDVGSLITDLVLLLLGFVVVALWRLNPFLLPLALSPLLGVYRVLSIPKLERQARIDGKTGLWNARHFMELFGDEFERAERFGRPMAVIMADLDLMRNMNNTYGHLAGDTVLAGIGKLTRENSRPYAIAGRFGGEEFCIVLPFY